MQFKKQHWYDVMLFVVAAALYAPSLNYGFVGDDLIYFIGNEYIKSFDVGTILKSGAIGADYLPLRDLSFALDYRLWGESPFWFHLTNVMLYGVTVVAVKHLFVDLNAFLVRPDDERADTPAFLAALLFAIHPTHRDVVCSVANRGALLTLLFCILACLSFLRYLQGTGNRYRSYAAALLFFVCALLSREYSISLPLALVLLVFFDDRARRTSKLIATTPFFITALVFYFIYKQYALSADYITSSTESLLSESFAKLGVAAKIAGFYMVRMMTFAGKFSHAESIIYALLAAGVVAGILSAAIIMRRRRPQLLFGFLFYLICLIPVLNFFKTDPVVAARYSYLPCLGLFFAFLAVPFVGRMKFVPVLCVAFTVSWSMATTYQLKYYENNITYWENIAPYAGTADVYLQLGYAYSSGGKYEKALEVLNRVQPAPEEPKYYVTVGKACYNLGDYGCAVRSLEMAMTLAPDDGSVPLNLARAHLAMGHRISVLKYCDFVSRNFPQMNAEVEIIRTSFASGSWDGKGK